MINISCYNTLSKLKLAAGALACTTITYINPLASAVAASLVGLGYAGKSLAGRCVFRTSEKTKVEGLPYPAFYLNSGCWRRVLTEFCGRIDMEFPGIMRILTYDRRDEELCYGYVSKEIRISVGLDNSVDFLTGNGYEIVESPRKNDIILYFNQPWRPPNHFHHIGLISKVEKGAVWVKSKWGEGYIYEHLETAVPIGYGNAIVYLRYL